jgi:serine/threonine-protein kinase
LITLANMPVGRACEYIRQAALALQHIQERGLVHRDIKPSNLVAASKPDPSVTGVGAVKLLDMGMARLAQADSQQCTTEELTGQGQVMATADYMAPEQAVDFHAADIRADIYSLGCTLYCILAGNPPFPGGHLHAKGVRPSKPDTVQLDRSAKLNNADPRCIIDSVATVPGRSFWEDNCRRRRGRR